MEDGIFFSQSKYIKEMLKKFGLEDSKPTKMPMSTEIKLTKDDEADSVDSSKYRGTKMPSEYQQDYNKALAYAPKICNDPNMTEQLRDIYRALESRFIMEFYKPLQLDRNLNNNHFHIQFVIKNRPFNLSLEKFAELTSLPNQGICLYSNAWGLDELEKNIKQVPPYNSTLPAFDDIRNLIHRRTIHEKENVYSAIGNKDHTQAIIALMLYCLENEQPFNLTYFIIRRMYYFRDRRDKVLPYGMILTYLFKNLKENMVDHPFDELYILVPRKISSLKAKQPKKPPPKRTRNVGKSKRAQLTTSSLSDSPPLVNEDLPSTKLPPRSYSRSLPNRINMSQDQWETRRMFKNLARALHKFAKMLKKGCR
ncbi:hypothetical protein Tco_0413141 [Tanacetum coccineum]